ncbi:MAG: sigma-70 family RNA polymerase sigma factor [Actinophytocola sp.]|uniref:RNA polymerase sigma factor n=1 Tax=Actinophytocola sp. TaxID=1872138 RepID=UPI003C7827D2
MSTTEDLLRDLAPQVLGALMRRHDDFAAAEDAVQDALIAAAEQWPRDGLPDYPRGWLIQVAHRRMLDHLRSEQSRRRREEEHPHQPPPEVSDQDDTLVLLFMCCHPALKPADAIALTLRAVGGLTTAEIAHAFLIPEKTMAQRISRAKLRIRESGIPFRLPAERDAGLASVLQVLYLVFNEGYASTGPDLQRRDLSAEAIRLARALHALLPDDSEVTGLLALMLLVDARREARTGRNGELIPLTEQDRDRWDRPSIDEGIALVTAALPSGPVGPYQVQAAINAVHDEAKTADDTDWPQLLALYGVLRGMSENPMVALNHAVAFAMVHGPAAALDLLTTIAADKRIAGHHRLHAVRAHLLEMAGNHAAATEEYRIAAARTTSVPEQRYLMLRAARG